MARKVAPEVDEVLDLVIPFAEFGVDGETDPPLDALLNAIAIYESAGDPEK